MATRKRSSITSRSPSHRGVTVLECAVTVGLLAVIVVMMLPFWRYVQLRSDLDAAVRESTLGLERAQFLSQTGFEDSAWGYQATQGIVYRGESFAKRDVQFDEPYPVPPTVAVAGVLDVTFARLTGVPNITGNILFTSICDRSATVPVPTGILLPKSGNAASQSQLGNINYKY